MVTIIKRFFVPFFFTVMLAGSALSSEPVQLFEPTDNRSRVIRAAYAYYPENNELRVRLTLANQQVKSGSYRNAEIIRHFIFLLSERTDTTHKLFCAYKGNAILAIYKDHKL